MLLDTYEQRGLLFNMNFKEAAGDGLSAYRGELILIEGEVGDASGRRKPPVSVMKQSVILASADKLKLLAGLIEDLAELEPLFARYSADFAPDAKVLFFVVNIPKPLKVVVNGVTCELIPLLEGMIWNELIDLLALEKGDFKGQSAGRKVLTVFNSFSDYKSKAPAVTWAEALGSVIAVKREVRGAI